MAVDGNRRDARKPVADTPQTPGTSHTPLDGAPVRPLMDPSQASPLSLLSLPKPNVSYTLTVSSTPVGEPSANMPQHAPTVAALTMTTGAVQTATITALSADIYIPNVNMRISHGKARAQRKIPNKNLLQVPHLFWETCVLIIRIGRGGVSSVSFLIFCVKEIYSNLAVISALRGVITGCWPFLDFREGAREGRNVIWIINFSHSNLYRQYTVCSMKTSIRFCHAKEVFSFV